MSTRACEQAKRKYRIEVVAAQVHQVYREVLEAQRESVRGTAAVGART
jgi:hypothetical protein